MKKEKYKNIGDYVLKLGERAIENEERVENGEETLGYHFWNRIEDGCYQINVDEMGRSLGLDQETADRILAEALIKQLNLSLFRDEQAEKVGGRDRQAEAENN